MFSPLRSIEERRIRNMFLTQNVEGKKSWIYSGAKSQRVIGLGWWSLTNYVRKQEHEDFDQAVSEALITATSSASFVCF